MTRFILLIIILLLLLIGCSSVKMGCTMNENKTSKDKVSDQVQECMNNPTIIIFKEF
jgi:hypothetical protein